MKIFPLSLLLLLVTPFVATAEPVRILRVGDSITRLTATNPTLADELSKAGVEFVFVGSQKPFPDRPGLATACEGFNGRPIEFFTTYQATYGDEPFNDNCPMADAIPLQRALQEEKPDVVLAMVGVNNLPGREPSIAVEDLTAKLENFCDKLEEWMPAGTRIVISTVPPANDEKDPGNPNRNERHRLYSEQVVKPVVQKRIEAGKPYTLADPNPVLTAEDLKDSVHPTQEGKAKLNLVWAEAILKALGKTPAPAPTAAE